MIFSIRALSVHVVSLSLGIDSLCSFKKRSVCGCMATGKAFKVKPWRTHVEFLAVRPGCSQCQGATEFKLKKYKITLYPAGGRRDPQQTTSSTHPVFFFLFREVWEIDAPHSFTSLSSSLDPHMWGSVDERGRALQIKRWLSWSASPRC